MPMPFLNRGLRSRAGFDGPSHHRLARPGAIMAAAASVAAVLLAPASASAATVGCGSPCDNKDPQTYTAVVGTGSGSCYQDAITAASTTYAELRYSPWCRTAWARQTGSIGYMSGVLVQSYYTDGRLRATYDDIPGYAGTWSSMANDKGLLARACFYQYNSELDQANDKKTIMYCTSKY